MLALASRVRYEVDAANPYPKVLTGHIRAKLRDGRVIEERQPHLRGGMVEPLTRADVEAKFRRNCEFGGWPRERIDAFLGAVPRLFGGALDFSALRG